MPADIERLSALLLAAGHQVERLVLAPDVVLLVTSLGGRVFGPFMNGFDRIGWRPNDKAFISAMVAGDWNIGGERVWIAPEGLFNFEDPDRIIETYRVEPALDPGQWVLQRQEQSLRLAAVIDLALTNGRGRTTVEIERHIEILPDASAVSCGYRQTIEVRRVAGPPLAVVPWVIRQVAPGSLAFVEAVEGAQAKTAFGLPPASALQPSRGWWRVPFEGPGFMKTIYHRDAIGTGLMGILTDDRQALLYEPALVDAARYPETAPGDTSTGGQAAALFYDSGRFGDYGEIELYGHRSGSDRGLLSTVVRLALSPAGKLQNELDLD